MCPRSFLALRSKPLPRLGSNRQRGIGLVAAVFLITVVSLLSAAVLRTVTTSARSHALDTLFHRAFLAAQSGAQLGSNRAIAPNGAASCTNWNWPLDDLGLASCTANVSCELITVDSVDVVTLRSVGRCGDAEPFAERRVLVRLVR